MARSLIVGARRSITLFGVTYSGEEGTVVNDIPDNVANILAANGWREVPTNMAQTDEVEDITPMNGTSLVIKPFGVVSNSGSNQTRHFAATLDGIDAYGFQLTAYSNSANYINVEAAMITANVVGDGTFSNNSTYGNWTRFTFGGSNVGNIPPAVGKAFGTLASDILFNVPVRPYANGTVGTVAAYRTYMNHAEAQRGDFPYTPDANSILTNYIQASFQNNNNGVGNPPSFNNPAYTADRTPPASLRVLTRRQVRKVAIFGNTLLAATGASSKVWNHYAMTQTAAQPGARVLNIVNYSHTSRTGVEMLACIEALLLLDSDWDDLVFMTANTSDSSDPNYATETYRKTVMARTLYIMGLCKKYKIPNAWPIANRYVSGQNGEEYAVNQQVVADIREMAQPTVVGGIKQKPRCRVFDLVQLVNLEGAATGTYKDPSIMSTSNLNDAGQARLAAYAIEQFSTY